MFKYLKPKHVIAAGAMIALTSCSQDDVIDTGVQETEKPRENEFTIDMLSRATDRTIDNLDTIWVFADNGTTQIFDFTAFIKDQYGRFVPAEKKYWPDGETSVNFIAVYPDPSKMTINKTPGNLTLDYTATQLPNAQYDLITASKQVTKQEYNGSIPLEFTHELAQIEIQAKIGPESDFKIEAYGVGLIGLYRTGTLNLSTKTWSNLTDVAGDTDQTELLAMPKRITTIGEEPTSLCTKHGNFYIVPQTCDFPNYRVDPVQLDGLNMRFYSVAYDKETNSVLYGKYGSPSNIKKPSDTIANILAMWLSYTTNSNPGRSYISLSADTIEFKAGTKYVFTLDVTNGIGYTDKNDYSPNTPVLPNKMSANVTVEEWTTTDFDSNAN